MKHDDPKLIDALAAEYVLGTLRGRARRRFERWRREWHVERRVQAWEDRLSGLALRLTPMRPSPHVWSQIEKRIGAQPTASSGTRTRPARPSRWRALAASIAILAVLAGGFATWRLMQAPDFLPLVTIVGEGATAPAWEIHGDASLRHLRAVAGAGATAQAGRSYELWALPDSGAAPVSLGLMPVTGQIDRELTEAQAAALQASSRVAVSLEPEGGSPTGAPTGPVLFVAERARV